MNCELVLLVILHDGINGKYYLLLMSTRTYPTLYILHSGILKNDEYELKLALPYLLYGGLLKNDECVLEFSLPCLSYGGILELSAILSH